MTKAITPAELPEGHPRKAYIGVDGTAYRILIPVAAIHIERVEGPTDRLGSWTFSSWTEVNSYLDQAAKTAPKGGAYDKHPFMVSWLDQQPYEGRYDLQNDGSFQQLQTHIRSALIFMVQDPQAGEIYPEEHRRMAAMFLETYDVGQPAVPAPDDWDVVHDYREGNRDFRILQAEVFAGCFIEDESLKD